ncbi:MAG: hypothetical protein WCI97_11050 [Bacteroidota bacterium]
MTDTLTHITTTVGTTLSSQVYSALSSMEWFLLFLGWLMYWLKGMDDLRKTNNMFTLDAFKSYLSQKIFEIPISILSLVIIALFAAELDIHGKLSVFLSGYAASSIVNGLLAYKKKP